MRKGESRCQRKREPLPILPVAIAVERSNSTSTPRSSACAFPRQATPQSTGAVFQLLPRRGFDAKLYFTRVQLGSPPKEYYVQIDTGSDVLWVNCSSCNGCPRSSGLEIPIQFYDPSSSSTASLISCSDRRCSLGTQSSDSGCSNSNHQCSYTFQYGDGSGTSGYYLSIAARNP
ncbi:hypothetical protein LXL04_000033 [Taraxacum kok-saghyz]